MTDHCFISYSNADGLEFARTLADELEGGEDVFIDVWFDKRNIDPGHDWDDQIVEGIKSCKCMVFVMTKDSTAPGSMCKNEWMWALKYKKVIIPIRLHSDAEQPFGLGSRQWVDFTGEFEHGLAKLRKFLRDMDSPKGVLQGLRDRLADAERALRRARGDEENRIKTEIDELKTQIQVQEKIVADPEAAKAQTQKNIEAGLERERKPEKPGATIKPTKFINQPPGIAQNYFRDREMETEQVILFLNNEAQRMMTIVGRGGAGKTAMVCRLLKHLENGDLPDDFEKKHGKVNIDGIIYLSEVGSRKVNFANLYADLCLLLPAEISASLTALYKEPQTSTETKTLQLLEALEFSGRIIILLDNFEYVVDSDAQAIKDLELDEALRTILHAPQHPLKVIITTRVTAHNFDLYEPARQRLLPLDTGLAPSYAKEALISMDENNLVGIKSADEKLLDRAVTRTLGLPRALEALYAALRSDRYTTLEELLNLPILPENVVRDLVGEAFNRLDVNAQKVMQALAVYNRPVTPAAVDYLLAQHLPAVDSAHILQRLANMHFARKESGRFYLHPVDREFAFGLIPEKELTTEDTESAEDFEEENSLIKVEPDDIISASDEIEGESNKDFDFDSLFKSWRASQHDSFTQHDLTLRAADYFAQARRPRAEWKTLDDLAAQLAEFELRCAASDYDTAASVLLEIDFDYLLLWGHHYLLIESHSRVKNKLHDKNLILGNMSGLGTAHYSIGRTKESIAYFEAGLQTAREEKDHSWESTFIGNLGNAYFDLGEVHKAIEFFEQILTIHREIGDRKYEGVDYGNLGNAYLTLGDVLKAIEYYEQALIVAREIKDRKHESAWLGNLGNCYMTLGNILKSIELNEQSLQIKRDIGDRRGASIKIENIGSACLLLGEYKNAKVNYQKAILFADEISFLQTQNSARCGLAETYLFQNDLVNARGAVKAAIQYDVPQNNHNITALQGIIALRQGEKETAQEAFTKSIAQADEILVKTPDYYEALDAKGLALCGLILAGRGDLSMPAGTNDSKIVPPDKAMDDAGWVAPTINDAIETFRAARKIAPHAGIIKRVLRLFDELVKCDEEGILKDVRKAVEGES